MSTAPISTANAGHAPEGTPEAAVLALGRAVQAFAYYDPHHPVAREALSETERALQAFFRDRPRWTFATTGYALVVDAKGPELSGPAASALARGLFKRKVLGFRLGRALDGEGLSALVSTLAEAPALLLEAGGVAARTAGTAGLEAITVDFGALFEGAPGHQLPDAVREDEVLDRALHALLHLSEGAGAPMAVQIGDVAGTDELGGFLEELVGRTERGEIGPDAAAETAWEAFALRRGLGGEAPDLERAAQVLAAALVRLPPEARLDLLLRLAEGEAQGGQDVLQHARGTIPERELVDALAGALVEGDQSDRHVRAVGRLIGHLHPVMADRRRLLAAVDAAARSRARPLDGLLWQTLEARTLGDERRGLLELTEPDSEAGLIEQASLRWRETTSTVPGQEVLRATDAAGALEPLAELYVALLWEESAIRPELAEEAVRLASRLEREVEESWADEIFVGLARQLQDGERRLREIFEATMLRGDAGRRTRVRAHPGTPSDVRAWLLLLELETADVAVRLELRRELERLPPAAFLPIVRGDGGAVGPDRLRILLECALVHDPGQGVRLAKQVLVSGREADAILALSLVARASCPEALRLLSLVAGARGLGPALRLLELSPEAKERWLPLAERAVEGLGELPDPKAVRILNQLLAQPPALFAGAPKEQLRRAAARALARRREPSAREALEQASKSTWRKVRLAAREAASGASSG